MQAIVRGFKYILNFKGRDRRSQFWPYAGVVTVISMVVGAVAIIPGFIGMMNQTLIFAEQNPDKATVYRTPTSVKVQIHDPSGMPPMDTSFMIWMLLPAVVLVVLLGAAVTRRLHDRGLSGLLGLVPVALGGAYFWVWLNMMTAIMSGPDTPIDEQAFVMTFLVMFLLAIIYMVSFAALVIVMCFKGKTGPNHYGPEPV